MHKITIITPSYNQGEFLEESIDSVLSQSYKNIEYIIIDGGSTDNSVDIIRKYEKYLKFWVSELDKGQSDAINKGFKYATGDIVNWLNSDDYYEKDALDAVADAFKRKKNAEVITGNERCFNGEAREIIKINNGTNIDDNIEKLIFKGEIDQPPTFFKRDVFSSCMPLNTDLHYTMDSELWMKYLIQFGKENVYHIDKLLVNFRIHNKSKSVSEQTLFKLDRNALKLQLGKSLGVSNNILNFIKNDGINEKYNYIFDKMSYHASINCDYLASEYALYYFPLFYKCFNYRLAREYFKELLKNQYGINLTLNFIKYYIMLFVFPETISNGLRRLFR